MLNHIVLMGRLTRDPELRRTPAGVAVSVFAIAVDRDFSNASTGERETDFIDIVAWRSTAEFVSKYFAKGRMAVVSGRLQIRTWNDKEGNKRRTAEVIADSIYFGDSKREEGTGNGYNAYSNGHGSTYGNAPANNAPATAYTPPGYTPQQSHPGYQQQQTSDYGLIEDDDGQLPF